MQLVLAAIRPTPELDVLKVTVVLGLLKLDGKPGNPCTASCVGL